MAPGKSAEESMQFVLSILFLPIISVDSRVKKNNHDAV